MSRCVYNRVVRRCCYFSEKRAERFVIFCAVAAVVVLKNGVMNWNKEPRMYSLLFFRKRIAERFVIFSSAGAFYRSSFEE